MYLNRVNHGGEDMKDSVTGHQSGQKACEPWSLVLWRYYSFLFANFKPKGGGGGGRENELMISENITR